LKRGNAAPRFFSPGADRGLSFENGLLQLELARKIPEAMKPRRVEIGAGAASRKTAKLSPGALGYGLNSSQLKRPQARREADLGWEKPVERHPKTPLKSCRTYREP
jgi:hypothetical protein